MALPKQETVCFHIKFAWHAINRMYNALGMDYDVTASVGFVLLNIDVETGTPATKIGPILGMEPRSLTRMLKTLETKGFIRRIPDPHDKRKVFIHLTELGKSKREVSKRAVKSYNQMIREHIPAEKLAVFFEVLDSIQKLSDKKQVLAFGETGAGKNNI